MLCHLQEQLVSKEEGSGILNVMASEREVFELSGPLHLAPVDWENADHRRSVAACLVQGVYILERDRQEKRLGSEAFAPRWWEFCHFQLLRQLVDDVDSSIFGAVYEFKPLLLQGHHNHKVDGNPRFVIAFRGTLTKPDSVSRDIELDLHLIQNGLHRTSRFEIAMQVVRNMVATVGDSNIWLAGHSLGSAMAMLAGRTMARTGIFLKSYLFNPPFFAAPIERIKDKKVKHGLRIAGSVITAGLALALKASSNNSQRNRVDEPFFAIASWVPSLFVNPSDHVGSEYIGYFEHRKNMEDIGAGSIERLATQNSIGGLLLNAFGRESEPIHLIPSANLVINLSAAQDFKQAHGIHQWWQPHLQLQSKIYEYS